MEHPVKLSEDTEKRFNQLERIIEKGMAHFIEVGTALMIIRDEKLYKIIFHTFEEYCKERWGFKRNYAYRLIESAKVNQNLLPIVNKPTHESQVRPLTHLEPKQQVEAWDKAVKTAPGGKLTARHVENVVQKMIEPESNEEPEDTPVLKQLKRYWAMADRDEKEIFLIWIKNGGEKR